MSEFQRREQDMHDLVRFLRNDSNYIALWDLLNLNRMNEFSDEKSYRKLRHKIFMKIINAFKPELSANDLDQFWAQDREQQDALSNAFEWFNWSDTDDYEHFRHRHNVLLPDWDLKYSFISTGHPSEEFGISKDIIAHVEELVVGKNTFRCLLDKYKTKLAYHIQQEATHTISSTLGLFFSPIQKSMSGSKQHSAVSEIYLNHSHHRNLLRPTPNPIRDRVWEVYLDPAQIALEKGRMFDFPIYLDIAKSHINDTEVLELLNDYWDFGAVVRTAQHLLIRSLKEVEQKIRAYKDNGLDRSCLFCHQVARANLHMLQRRLFPHEFKNRVHMSSFKRTLLSDHNLQEREEVLTPSETPESFEDHIRCIDQKIEEIVTRSSVFDGTTRNGE